MSSVRLIRAAKGTGKAAVHSVQVFLRDVGHGLLQVSRNAFAVLGLVLASLALFAAGHADVRHEAEAQALGWLQARQVARIDPPTPETRVPAPSLATTTLGGTKAETPVVTTAPTTLPLSNAGETAQVARPTSFDLKDLSRPQAAVANWLARRYKVAPEPVGALVSEAWQVGNKAGLDPTLILAIMAVESSFNPFAQSAVGAQGLMQVMTRVHNAKYVAFGGNHAAFDPMTNLRVGVQVLKECIAHAGSLEAGLRFYVGSGNQAEDGGYASKVLSEQNSLRLVVGGKAPPPRAPAATVAGPARQQEPPAPAALPKADEGGGRAPSPEDVALLQEMAAH